MVLQSTSAKILSAIIGIAIVLIIIDFVLFQLQNITALVDVILLSFELNPIMSWGIVIVVGGFGLFIGVILFYRRRIFKSSLRNELFAAERVTLLELAQKLDATPARIEVEMNRLTSSKVSKFPGLLIISQGKHVFLGQKLLDQIIEAYNEGEPRGDIANTHQISRDEIDKAITYLIDSGVIEEREEKTARKVRPSYRRGTR
ncbi:MAG: hypothetical protein Q6364_09070 [Candidatus Hermodarchaeota archaeon]|nr:hypothetical protein [Candidatus Hermodarchaeota archaeon]